MTDKIRKFVERYFRSTDLIMLACCVCLSIIGILIQYTLSRSSSANTLNVSNRQFIVQIGASVIGIMAAIIISCFDYHFMAELWKLYIPASLFLVLLTFIFGVQVDETVDDKAWLKLPMGLTFQPSELLKICFILSFAYHLSKVQGNLNSPLNICLLGAHGIAPVALVHFQGDDGTAIVFAFIFIVMIVIAGLDWKYIVAGLVAIAVAAPLAWLYVLSDDQRNRFLSVYSPSFVDTQGISYQQVKSGISIGLGQLFGTGLFQKDYWYVPKMHNDFVFAFIGQAMGFAGSMLVIFLLGGLCFRSLANARHAADDLGTYICYGVFAMFFIQCFINIGMCCSVIPVIGITLPFLSAGGTSIVITYMGIGLVMSVHTHQKNSIFYG